MTFDLRQQELFNWIEKLNLGELTNFRLISGDASFRRYFRLQINGVNRIAVDAPPQTEDNPLFVALAETLASENIIVPTVVAHHFELGFMLLIDLGDVHLANIINQENYLELYPTALDELPKLINIRQTRLGDIPQYDKKLVHFELSIFVEWLVEKHLGLVLPETDQALLKSTFSLLAENFLEQPKCFVHRDFHSRNLMLPDENIAIIDFQGGLIGPITYDPVSLLKDCYVKWPIEKTNQLSQAYRQTHFANIAPAQWQRWYDLTGMQRHIKAAGIFARLHHRDGKPHYLADIPRTLSYISDACQHYSELTDFGQWLEQVVICKLDQQGCVK
ncbi:phosphotransferase [Catenovulum sp. SM1970]|uniref:aminoglycoside phosphotransferase family protein n=1 Tax=Marinifaba aquimaris TaxID=2741323 RepID=UPI001573AEE8|nr:phosphotransferase [Marinifaba aquimaris]NTS77445.1 phosphotransferase [Marinifaba aquimaris]